MERNKLNASEVARRIWGVTKDGRGYDVARNRDRIGAYLAGTSYPEPANLEKLAAAVGVPVEELLIERENPGPKPTRSYQGGRGDFADALTVPDRPNRMRLQVDQEVDWELAVELLKMLKEAKMIDVSTRHAQLGTVVAGTDTEPLPDIDAEAS